MRSAATAALPRRCELARVPGGEVSWQVTGARQDAWANANRIPVERLKPEEDTGKYLHPKAHGVPEEMGIQPQGANVTTTVSVNSRTQ